MSKVLLVEDSEEYQLMVSRAFADSEIKISVAGSVQEARELTKKSTADFDLAILDLSLPDGDGFQVMAELRKAGMSSDTPIFFLTSQAELHSKVAAFNLGVDDYLVKPISPVELKARVEMRLKKAGSSSSGRSRVGDLQIEMRAVRASRFENGKCIDLCLTAKEFKILTFLIQNDSRVFSRLQLVKAVWGPEMNILNRTVDSHIYGLRKKMGPLSHYVECISGQGYRFQIIRATEKAS